MTAATLILPYRRSSPARIPVRDLMVGAADSLSIRVTVMESDEVTASPLEITDGIGTPSLRFIVWGDWFVRAAWTDYGRPTGFAADVIIALTGVATVGLAGTFDVDLTAASVDAWPRRCGFSVQLDWDGGLKSELLCQGALQVLRGWAPTVTTVPVLTDTGDDILLA